MSFYKDDNGTLLYAATTVSGPGYTLVAADHLSYSYPVHGWWWFDSEGAARTALGLPVDVDAVASVLDMLSTTPIDMAALTVNLDFLAAFVGDSTVSTVGQDITQLHSLIATMAAFVTNPAPTANEAFAAIRAVCENSVVVDRVTISVLADVIRYILQLPTP